MAIACVQLFRTPRISSCWQPTAIEREVDDHLRLRRQLQHPLDPAGMILCWIPFVGMLMMPGRQCRYALATMSGRSLRKVGSPPLNVNQYGARPSDSKTRFHSRRVRSSFGAATRCRSCTVNYTGS